VHPRRQLCPLSCPPAPANGAAEPKRPGIIIRVSGVRVPPPASEAPANWCFLRRLDTRNQFRVSPAPDSGLLRRCVASCISAGGPPLAAARRPDRLRARRSPLAARHGSASCTTTCSPRRRICTSRAYGLLLPASARSCSGPGRSSTPATAPNSSAASVPCNASSSRSFANTPANGRATARADASRATCSRSGPGSGRSPRTPASNRPTTTPNAPAQRGHLSQAPARRPIRGRRANAPPGCDLRTSPVVCSAATYTPTSSNSSAGTPAAIQHPCWPEPQPGTERLRLFSLSR
jgi:hypothetical protein